MAVISVRINDGDNLQNIAMRILGDASRWGEIANFNRLHSPYISNDILDYYGYPSAQGRISAVIDVNDHLHTFSLLPIPSESLIDPTGILIIGQYGINGRLIYDTLPVIKYDASTGTITTAIPPSQSYTENSYWFAYPSERATKTLRTGDLLYIQVNDGPPVRATQKFFDSLGTDILLDDHGKLQWTSVTVATGNLRITGMDISNSSITIPTGTYFAHNESGQIYQSSQVVTANPDDFILIIPVSSVEIGALGSAGKGSSFTLVGTSVPANIVYALRNATIVADTLLEAPYRPADVGTISGASNVRQALINRLGTRRGELVYHPNYGNEAFEQIGLPNTESTLALIEAYSIDCMKNESRISEILGGKARRDSDAAYVTMNVRVRSTGERVTIDDVRLRLLDSESEVLSR